MISTDDAARLVDTTRVTINAWIAKGRAIGLTQTKRGFRMPRWQFEPAMWAAIPKLSAALGTTEGWALLSFLESPHGALEGLTPRQAIEQGRAEPFRPPNIASLPERYRDPQNRFVINYAELFGVVYNTNRLKPADLPKSPADLLNARYKGMIIDDPMGARTTELAWIDLYNSGKIDASFIKAMKAQATVVPSTAPFFNQLTTGTVAMIPWGGHARYLGLKNAGAPVGFLAVPGLAVPVLAGTVVLKGAPHPKAAQLFQAWFLSTEAQNAIVTLGNSYGLTATVKLPDNEADWPKLPPIAAALKPVAPDQFIAARDALAELEAGRSGIRHYGPEGQTTPEDLVDAPTLSVFVESWAPPPQMWIFGAVDFTAALSRVEVGPRWLGVRGSF
mgnify:CR=1 FL=1